MRPKVARASLPANREAHFAWMSPANREAHFAWMSPANREAHFAWMSPANREAHFAWMSPANREAHFAWMAPAAFLVALFLTGCTAGPNYQRPAVPVPPAFRSPTPGSADPASLADLPWFEVFKDEQLQVLNRAALQNNYDLRDAV